MKTIIILFTLSLLLSSCDKKNTTSNSTNNSNLCGPSDLSAIDTFLLQNFLFNSGSYWVYLDSLNNTYDSCYLIAPVKKDTTYILRPTYPDEGPCTYYVRYAYNNKSISKIQYDYFMQGNSIKIFAPFDIGSLELCHTFSGTLSPPTNVTELIYPTLLIDTTSYSNVKKFSLNTYGNPDSVSYFLKYGIGIIKTELYYSGQKRTYNLVRYRIQ